MKTSCVTEKKVFRFNKSSEVTPFPLQITSREQHCLTPFLMNSFRKNFSDQFLKDQRPTKGFFLFSD